MPYTLKTQQISVKDPDSGEYIGVDVLTEQTTEGLIAELQAEGDTQVARINQAAVDVQSAVDQAETEAQQLISSTQSSLNTLESQKDTIAQTIASMAELGTDTTLSTEGMAADAKAVGDEFTNVKNALNKGFVLESGTFQDGDGKTKTNRAARIRCKDIMPLGSVYNAVSVPTGFDIWLFFLDSSLNLISTRGWLTGIIPLLDIAPLSAKYINFAIRKTDEQSSDISSYISSVQSSLKFYNLYHNSVLPIWNQSPNGIELSGKSVLIHPRGFAISYNGTLYYIAPVDGTSEVVLTSPYSNQFAACINVENLTSPGARNEPSTCIEFIPTVGTTLLIRPNLIPFAQYYDSSDQLRFTSDFAYFDLFTNRANDKRIQPVALASQFAENHYIKHAVNSATLLNSAIASGYKAVEFDVVFTSDLIPVISHDLSFTVDDVTYVIAENTYDDLLQVKPDLASLEELLKICKNNNVICDIDYTKLTYTTEQNEILYETIIKVGMKGRCFVTAASADYINLTTLDGNLCLCASSVSTTGGIDTASTNLIGNSYVGMISCQDTNVTKSLVEYCHSKGLLFKAWVIDNQATADTLWNYGVDFIITNSILAT